MFDNKVLMITGGTGSFGNTVLERFLDTDVKEIRVFSRDEKKQEEMRILLSNDKVKFYIGDVRDYESLSQAMAQLVENNDLFKRLAANTQSKAEAFSADHWAMKFVGFCRELVCSSPKFHSHGVKVTKGAVPVKLTI